MQENSLMANLLFGAIVTIGGLLFLWIFLRVNLFTPIILTLVWLVKSPFQLVHWVRETIFWWEFTTEERQRLEALNHLLCMNSAGQINQYLNEHAVEFASKGIGGFTVKELHPSSTGITKEQILSVVTRDDLKKLVRKARHKDAQ